MDSQNVLLSSTIDTSSPPIEIPFLAPPLPNSASLPSVHSDAKQETPSGKHDTSQPLYYPVIPSVEPSIPFQQTAQQSNVPGCSPPPHSEGNAFTHCNSLLQISNTYSVHQRSYLTETSVDTVSSKVTQECFNTANMDRPVEHIPQQAVENISVNPSTNLVNNAEEESPKTSTKDPLVNNIENIPLPSTFPVETEILGNPSISSKTPEIGVPTEIKELSPNTLIDNSTPISSPVEEVPIPPSSLSISTSHISHSNALSISIPHPSLLSHTSADSSHQASAPTFHQPVLCYTRILLGEITPLLSAMRQATPRWSQHQSVSCKLNQII